MIILLIKFILFVAFFISGLLVVRKFVHHSKLEIHNEVAGFIYAVLGVIYAVLLAFVVVTVWEEYSDAEKNVNMEVSHVIDVYRNANAFPDPVKNEIQSRTENYINDMINYEWKAMYNLQISQEAKKSYLNIWESHQAYVPETDFERIWYSESIKELNELADARRLRIISINYDVPLFMWAFLFIGAFITIGFSYLFGTKNEIAQIIMVFSLSAIICLVLLLIEALVHPFTGLVHLSPQPFIDALKQLK